jgi:hypothetical protein
LRNHSAIGYEHDSLEYQFFPGNIFKVKGDEEEEAFKYVKETFCLVNAFVAFGFALLLTYYPASKKLKLA